MQNKKIIIFGDSFADPTDRCEENKQVTTWYDCLKHDYKITNHALSGTGPHYSFKEYYNFISSGAWYGGWMGEDKTRLEDYICIFLLSGEDRIAFPKASPNTITHINWNFDKKESWWCENEQLKKEKIYYETFKSEIDFFFLTMHDDLIWSNFKNLGFLHMNSLLLNMKTIVFCTFGIKVLSKMDPFLDIAKLNTPNFYTYPVELGHISHEEFIDVEENEGYDYVDLRRNHLSQENHTILYENIKKFINNDYNPLPFTKDIDYSTSFGKRRDTKTGKFIYE